MPAHAQTASAPSSVDALRAEADRTASRYFATLARVQALDGELTRIEAQITDLEAKATAARDAARARAVAAYRQSGTRLASLIDSGNAMQTSRRVHLIDEVNRADQRTFARVRRLSSDLDTQRRALETTRSTQNDALASLQAEGAAIDAKLAAAARQEASQQAAARAAAVTAGSSTTTTAPPVTAAAPTTTTAPPRAVPTPPPDYTGTPGTSPHHDDPFLTCVRQRESGGNYGAVNPAGPYLGAYQFSQPTWNAAANHAHRTDLVGVPANTASPYDQDEVAWSLYQWQGAAPWGGHCP